MCFVYVQYLLKNKFKQYMKTVPQAAQASACATSGCSASAMEVSQFQPAPQIQAINLPFQNTSFQVKSPIVSKKSPRGCSFLWVVETLQQGHHRALAPTTGAHQAHGLPSTNLEANAFQHLGEFQHLIKEGQKARGFTDFFAMTEFDQ